MSDAQIIRLRSDEAWISRNVDTWKEQVTEHPNKSDPHPQYLLESVALQIFAFTAYGGMAADPPIGMDDIGAGWEIVPWNALTVAVPRGITLNTANDSFSFDNRGVYRVTVTGSFDHNEQNQGRVMNLRLYNVTADTVPGTPIRIPTGRNSPGTAAAFSTLAEITEQAKGNAFRIEVGGTVDDYIGVDWQGQLSINNVGEWREPLPESQALLGGGVLLTGGGEPLTT